MTHQNTSPSSKNYYYELTNESVLHFAKYYSDEEAFCDIVDIGGYQNVVIIYERDEEKMRARGRIVWRKGDN